MYVYNFRITGEVGEVYSEHVKSEDSYGSPRWIPLIHIGVPVIENYLEAKEMKLRMYGKESDTLFPPLKDKEEFV